MKQQHPLVWISFSTLLAWSPGPGSPPAPAGMTHASAPASMFIQSCSLGCSAGAPGTPIGCSLVNLSPNSEIAIDFSQRVDLASVSTFTVQLVNLVNGTIPSGTFQLDEADPSRLIFRPSLDFDVAGNPIFGFEANATYGLRIPGTDLSAGGPFLRSTSGADNSTEMNCVVVTSQPITDVVPGPPTMTAFVTDTLDSATGEVTFDPVTHDPVGGVLLDGATGLETAARIVLIFDDVMNPATIANRSSGQSNSMDVRIDVDGDLSTVGDQVVQLGAWDVSVDAASLLRTTAIFTPTGGHFPDGGTDIANPRMVVSSVTNAVSDLVGNPLANAGTSSFSMAIGSGAEEVLLETFLSTNNEDASASGGAWGNGKLSFGKGGGSGRLGELHLRDGETLTLDTDSQTFPVAGQPYGILSNVDPDQYNPLDRNTWPTVTIDRAGEGFEFSELALEGGARLVLRGSRPGRVFVRGEIVNDGVIDLSGETPPAHVSNTGGDQVFNELDGQSSAAGGLGGLAGPAGGAGGQGADRMDMTSAILPVMINIGGILNPGAQNDGRGGLGVGGAANGTGGRGGRHYPPQLPLFFMPSGPFGALYGDAEMSNMSPFEVACRIAMVAGAGSGGSHALEGSRGLAFSPFVPSHPNLLPNSPTPTPGGDNASLALEAPGSPASPINKRNLEFWNRHLRGGAGGGGGGTSVYASRSNSAVGPNCDQAAGLFPFWDHSAAGGGGGGGALMIAAGRRLTLTGVVDCSGGEGGSSTQPGASPTLCTQSGAFVGFAPDCGMMAAPGGGGAGGAVRLQAPILELAVQDARIDVRGGNGGQGAGNSFGGEGSPGLVRLEYTGFLDQSSDAAQFGPSIAPSFPSDMDFNNPFTSAAILSIGEWGKQRLRPESFSGSQSCWMQPTVTSFFSLTFVEDVAGAPTDLSRFGWNMDIVFDVPGVGRRLFPYRGIPPVDATAAYAESSFPAAALGGVDFATYVGTTLNHDEPSLAQGSFVAVRFQGARGTGSAADACSVDLETDIQPDTLTPFVSHPALLNGFAAAPNMVRFAIVFDAQLAAFDPLVAARVKGVTNLRIRTRVN